MQQMSNSYRTVIERMRQFADGHFILKKFYHGQIDAADLDKEPLYPLMHIICNEIAPTEGILDYQLSVRFADVGRDKESKTEYQKEIISDMTRIALHLVSEIQNGQVLFGTDAEVVDKRATIQPFAEEFKHRLTGVQLDFTLRLPYDWSACDIPADYSPNISDNPEIGGGILTKIGIYNDGTFVGYTSFLDFSDDFTATIVDNKISITLNGAGAGLTCADLPDCQTIIDINTAISGIVSDISAIETALGNKENAGVAATLINEFAATLAPVATTNDYNDLDNKPSFDWGVLSLTETAARYDDYSPAGWNDEKVISINANYVDKVQIYSGIRGGYAGRIVTLRNSSADNLIILEKNSTNSSAANRMRFQGRSAYFLFPNEEITLIHNGTDWGALSSSHVNGHMAFDDMLGSPNQASPVIYYGESMIGVANGTGALVRNDNMMSAGFGTITLTTGTVATNSATLKSMGRSGFFSSGGVFSRYCVVARINLQQLPTAAQDFIFGVGISSSGNTNGLSVVGSMSWYCSFANSFWRNYSSNTAGTLITDTTTSLPVTTNVVVLGTYHPNNLGDCVYFYSADGGMTYNVSSRFVRVTNNYGGTPVVGINKTVGTTSVQANVDYVALSCKGGVI